ISGGSVHCCTFVGTSFCPAASRSDHLSASDTRSQKGRDYPSSQAAGAHAAPGGKHGPTRHQPHFDLYYSSKCNIHCRLCRTSVNFMHRTLLRMFMHVTPAEV
uniref:Uncharacterized protein n=1 Tax=Periophthalmus magnuspinnatus TaxID=409849 RepID=A0A3B4AIP3_9GOBI